MSLRTVVAGATAGVGRSAGRSRARSAACTLAAALVAAVLLSACTAPARRLPEVGAADGGAPNEAYWQGKLALRVGEAHGPQSYFANFELSGSARRGELLLTGPLGTTLARLSWRPGQAVLQRSGNDEVFDDLDALAARATGTALPIAALFEWLQGHAVAADGWQADLADLGDGRLRAHRAQPAPEADLQLVFER